MKTNNVDKKKQRQQKTRKVRYHQLVLISGEQAKTMRNVAIEMAMDLCIDEKDEERESEAQPACQLANKLNGM